MYNTAQTEPHTDSSSLSQVQRLAQAAAQVRESIDNMMQVLPHMEQYSAIPKGKYGPPNNTLHWLNNDSIDKIVSQKFCMDNLAELLGAIHSSLFGTVVLMRNMDEESALPGFVIQMIGDDMQKKLDLLLSIQSYCEELKSNSATKNEV